MYSYIMKLPDPVIKIGLWSYYKEGGYDPIIKNGLWSYYKEGGDDPIIKKGVMILL